MSALSADRNTPRSAGDERQGAVAASTLIYAGAIAMRNAAGYGACILGHDGSVALYVTHHKGVRDTDWSERDPSAYLDWGAKVTVIPASAISEIDVRAG